MSTNSCSGGAAAAVPQIKFLGNPEKDSKALYLPPPEKICLTFPWTSNSSGEITGDLKVIFAQMIYASAYRCRSSIERIPGIVGEVSPPDHLLIMHPNGYANRFINKIRGCTYVGEVQIPWQFTRMDGVFENMKMSSSSSYGGGDFKQE